MRSAIRRRQAGWSEFYGRTRQSRLLAAILIVATTAVWFTARTRAYTELVQNKRQQTMNGFGLLMSAATAPTRYFPWYADSNAAGQYDAETDVFKDFRPFRRGKFVPSELVRTEKGLLIVIRLASLVFGASASAATLVAVQLALDLLTLYSMCFLLWRWGGPLAAAGGSVYYATAGTAAAAATFPFYYYWPIPFGVLLCLVADRAARRGLTYRFSVAVGLGLSAGLWLLFRATSILVPGAIAVALMVARVPLRRVAPLILLVVVLQQIPALLVAMTAPRNEPARLGRSNIWHSLYIGIGTRPNPYGIVFSDSNAADMVWTRYHIAFEGPGYEMALKREYLKILRANPGLIVRNALLNFADSVKGWSFAGLAGKVGRGLWLGALAGLVTALRWQSNKTFPFTLASALWLTQCATLGFVCRPQESYLWETLAIAALAGFGGLGMTFEWALERLGWTRAEASIAGLETLPIFEPKPETARQVETGRARAPASAATPAPSGK